MHILIISTEDVWAEDNKLLGIFQLDQAKALRKDGVKVNILSPSIISLRNVFNVSNYTYRMQTFCVDDIVVYKYQEINFALGSPLGFMNAWLRAGLKLFIKYIEINGLPDIIHAHNFLYAGILANKLSDKYGVSFVVTEHSSIYTLNLSMKNRVKTEIKFAILKSSRNIFVSNYLKESFFNYFSVEADNHSVVIPNVLSDEFESMSYNTQIKSHSNFSFINVASLVPVKNQISLINAFNSVFHTNPNVNLKIVGAGPLMDNLKETVKNLGLCDRIFFKGQLETKILIAEMAKADCFVLSSVRETFGVAIIEAMAVGLQIITSNCGGAEEVVNNLSLAIVYDQYKSDDLEIKMLSMYENRENFRNEEIMNYARSQFGSSNFSKTLINNYKSIINNRSNIN